MAPCLPLPSMGGGPLSSWDGSKAEPDSLACLDSHPWTPDTQCSHSPEGESHEAICQLALLTGPCKARALLATLPHIYHQAAFILAEDRSC